MDNKGIYRYKYSLWRFHSQFPCCAANTTLHRSLSSLVSPGSPTVPGAEILVKSKPGTGASTTSKSASIWFSHIKIEI